MEQFPQPEEITDEVIDELIGILLHGSTGNSYFKAMMETSEICLHRRIDLVRFYGCLFIRRMS